MNLLPLVERELRVSVRKPIATWLRLICGGGGLLIIVWATMVWTSWVPLPSLGSRLVECVTLAGFSFAALAGLFQTADSMSQEKRDGTLGFLFLTDLNSADVVFGKLTAKLMVPAYGLLATFPALAVCILFGGVSGAEFWRLCLVLANTLCFSLSICLTTSLFCREQRAAQAMALVVILAFSSLAAGLGFGWAPGTSLSVIQGIAIMFSPAVGYVLAFDWAYQSAGGWYWMSLISTHVLAWMSLGFACWYLSNSWRQGSVEAIASVENSRQKFLAAKEKQRIVPADSARLLDSAPMVWLANRRRPSVLLLGVLPLALTLYACIYMNSWQVRWVNAAVLGFTHAGLIVWIAGWSSYLCAADRKSGALELLLGTPLGSREVAAGWMRTFRRHFGPTLLALVGIDLLIALGGFGVRTNAQPTWALVAMVVTVVNCYCVCWIGLWRGVASVTPAWAVTSTLATIFGLPWIWFGAAAVVFGNSTTAEFIMLWLVLNVANSLVFAVKARDGFLNYFRTMALRPFAEKRPVVESSWSPINWESESQRF